MPNRGRKVIFDGGWKYSRVVCRFCEKILTKKEQELHIYVCEEVPQEIFQPNTHLGGSSVSTGTTSNSSLTNPLLGAPPLK